MAVADCQQVHAWVGVLCQVMAKREEEEASHQTGRKVHRQTVISSEELPRFFLITEQVTTGIIV